jgi:hypothetical protein
MKNFWPNSKQDPPRNSMRQCLVFLLLLNAFSSAFAAEITGIVQANLISADSLTSWQNKDTGILRDDDNGLNLQQAAMAISGDLGTDFSVNLVANYYHDGEQHLGISQAQLIYKPLSSGQYRWRARAGFFYPKLSLENVDKAWLSPYTYTQSAINSWFGEELRTLGLEVSLDSPGRARHSPWSWQLNAATFKGNDPLGTVISWRGFAMHDRQSLNHDRVEFAVYPSVVARDGLWHPSWVEPFHEIDGRFGYYLGLHLDYYKQSSLRYYYYDNRANPLAVNEQRLYAWRTKFHSLALQHKFSSDTRLIAQVLSGSTLMGAKYVYVDFNAWYLMISHTIGPHRLSLRYDNFEVSEKASDILAFDPNSSDGKGLTLAWRYNWRENWQVGLEYHQNHNKAQNRLELGQAQSTDQNQAMAVIQYRW